VASGGCPAKVALKTVPTIEKLADIAADVVHEDEAATRVLIDKLLDIEDELVKDD